MTLTPQMIAETHAYRLKAAERAFTEAQDLRIGSRWTDPDGYGYTLVALRVHNGTPPLAGRLTAFYSADDRDHQSDILTLDEIDDEPLTPAADDPELAAAARRDAAASRDRFSHEDMLWDNPTSVEQIVQALAFGEADRAWREAKRAEERALRERGTAIAGVVHASGGNQSSAARLIALDQSRVSRALKSQPGPTMAP